VSDLFFLLPYFSMMKDQENISPIEQYVIDFIRNLRNNEGISQDGLANILGVGKSFISNVESLNQRAKYNLNHINALADYFNLAPAAFLPGKAFPEDKIRPAPLKKNKTSTKRKATGKKK
jgi:transcriptional regulator with XRE-family HTH domain